MAPRDPDKSQADRELVRGCIERDPRAWQALIDQFGALVVHAVRNTLQRVMKNVDPNQVDEAAQTVWAALCDDDGRRLRSFAGQSALSTWLTVLSTRRALDYIRTEMRKGSMKTLQLETGDADLTRDLRDSDSAPAFSEDERDLLYEGLERVPPEDRLILKMYYIDGLSYRTIAKAIRVAPNTVSSYLFRAREKLKTALSKRE